MAMSEMDYMSGGGGYSFEKGTIPANTTFHLDTLPSAPKIIMVFNTSGASSTNFHMCFYDANDDSSVVRNGYGQSSGKGYQELALSGLSTSTGIIRNVDSNGFEWQNTESYTLDYIVYY